MQCKLKIANCKLQIGVALRALALLLAGCGYMVGTPTPPDVCTVSVPIFTSDSFRRGFEFQLTEAVKKQITTQTHLRLADEPHADTRLTGHIVDIRKNVLSETGFDDPRELQLSLSVLVTWEDLRTGQILAQQQVPLPPEATMLVARADFAPELGQSLATATHDVVDRLAHDIVNRMEMPW